MEVSGDEFLLVTVRRLLIDPGEVCIYGPGLMVVKKCVHVIILGPFSDEEEVRGVKVEKKEKC